jgi:hypothetical protein
MMAAIDAKLAGLVRSETKGSALPVKSRGRRSTLNGSAGDDRPASRGRCGCREPTACSCP